MIAAHAGVEKIANDIEFLKTFDDHFGACAARGCLYLDVGDTEPALDEPGTEVDVLDAGVGEIHLAAEEYADAHVDALFVETVAERVIAKIEIGKRDHEERPGEERADHVERPQGRVRSFQCEDSPEGSGEVM